MVFALLLLAPFGLFAVARGLRHIFCRPSYLSTLGNSAWFTYGSFLGETVGANFEQTTSMRYHWRWTTFGPFSPSNKRLSLLSWLCYSFVVTASYGGELRAFLMRPMPGDPIETVRDIVDRATRWRAVDYGDGFWDKWKHASDGMRELVEGMERVEYKPFPVKLVGDD